MQVPCGAGHGYNFTIETHNITPSMNTALNRRHFLRLATLASLCPLSCSRREKESEAPLAPPAPPVPRAPSGLRKKGLGFGTKKEGWDTTLTNLRCKWFYSWTNEVQKTIPEGIDFIPMVFGKWGIKESAAKAAAFAKKIGVREILGYNEPDESRQANLSVEKALDAWPLLMETGLRLGSPSCVHPDREWMKEFMAGVKDRKLRVDFVCMHSYGGPSPKALVERIKSIHAMFGKPIWITEFAVGDWEAKSPEANRHKPERVLKFMEEALPLLNAMDIVERYAWFPARQNDNALCTSALFDKDGTLTPLGECYSKA